MADAGFRNQQWLNRYSDHIAPINRLVDELCNDGIHGWAPYVAPMYGGVNARLLSVLRDPGPRTQDSRFLCVENDDPTAEAMFWLLREAGIGVGEMVPWNAYPWYINRAPTAAEIHPGVAPLRRIIELLPDLRVVVLHGVDAKKVWKRFDKLYHNIVDDLTERGVQIIKTYHTSRQAFRHPDPVERERRKQHLRSSLLQAKLACE